MGTLHAFARRASLAMVRARTRHPLQFFIAKRLVALVLLALGVTLVALYVFFYQLSWVPGSGRLDPGIPMPPRLTGLLTVDALLAGRVEVFGNAVQHLILPACVLAAFNMGLFTRFTRSAVLEVLEN